jgi:hypothetical protein
MLINTIYLFIYFVLLKRVRNNEISLNELSEYKFTVTHCYVQKMSKCTGCDWLFQSAVYIVTTFNSGGCDANTI